MNIWTLREIYPKVVIKGKEYANFDEAWTNATPGTCSECEEKKPVIICEHPYLEHVEWYDYEGYPYWCQDCYERQYLAAMSVFSSFKQVVKLKDIQPYTIVRLERAVELLVSNRMVVTERYNSATNHYLCRPAGCTDSIQLSGDEEGEVMERINVVSGESQDD